MWSHRGPLARGEMTDHGTDTVDEQTELENPMKCRFLIVANPGLAVSGRSPAWTKYDFLPRVLFPLLSTFLFSHSLDSLHIVYQPWVDKERTSAFRTSPARASRFN